MVKPVTEGRRCWVLSYSDGAQFHMDIAGGAKQRTPEVKLLEAYGPDSCWSETAIVITDLRSPNYDPISNDWQRSNPKGYAKWFQQRMGPIFERKRRALANRSGPALRTSPNIVSRRRSSPRS